MINRPAAIAAPIGGSERVLLELFSITQCDAADRLAGIWPVADGSGQP